VDNRWGRERKAHCKCDFLAGTCANIECPHPLNSRETSSLWIEGWALSKYSFEPYKKTRIGGLIKKIKYSKSKDYSIAQRSSDAKIISDEIIEMIKWLYDPRDLPFDLCICPPSHEMKPLDLPDFICKSISGGSIRYGEKTLVERIPLTTIKAGPKEDRSNKLVNNFVFDCPQDLYPSKGVLIIDDVFDTGATMTGVSRAVSAQFPKIPRFIITAAYIGHMGRISAV
jgi:hypothetical protein